jgi:translation initiation factor 1
MPGSVALPLPEWGFAVDGGFPSRRDQSLSSQEDCRWPKKPHPSPPLVAWYFPPDCSKPVDACICKQTVIPAGDGIARVRRESKGRGGKTVTTITGVPLAEDALKDLATTLKKRCGTGGALKDGIIEIQGDHVELLLGELIKLGFKAKKSGG